ncbi:MAG: glycoside hydrolase family 5 protein [Erysipelotrichaceae bacterium]|nr:glycoside hydrolase family 5 protein [Erysipelotrichaceae bacterium]
MKKLLTILLCLLVLAGCQPRQSFDGKDRPSVCGRLQVVDGRLCDKNGNPVMLRGISNNGVSASRSFSNEDSYKDISHFMGANVYRLALYTYGVGSVGYCTGGDKQLLMQDIIDGVEYGRKQDMYVIIDWHILSDGDPNKYIDDAKIFFDEVSKKCAKSENVIYEICNEPNKCSWADIKEYAEVIIPIIRANDPKALIIVGTPNWSQDVDVAAQDPLNYDNIMYTLHFYSATHKQGLRDKASQAMNSGLPLFVTEFGITASSGGFPVDEDEANVWIDFLEEKQISYVMWYFSRTGEPCAALNFSSLKTKDLTDDDLSRAGLWLKNTIAQRSQK